jgi:pimeloyl-ACP methyl ester carboxylesterase
MFGKACRFSRLILIALDRILSGALGAMGWMPEGGFVQKIWENMHPKTFLGTPAVCVLSIAQLAVSKNEIESITLPVEVLIGDRDPIKELYVRPLQSARPDWPVLVIAGAGHLTCFLKPQFVDGLVKWIDANPRG